MSNLQHLLGHYSEHPAVKKILEQLENEADRVRLQLGGLTGAQESFAIAATVGGQKSKAPVVHLLVANSKEEAAYRHNDLEGILGKEGVFFSSLTRGFKPRISGCFVLCNTIAVLI